MSDAPRRNPLEQDPEYAWSTIRHQRLEWDQRERVTDEDDLAKHEKDVCEDCGQRLGHSHLKDCPQRGE